jgi:DNA-binding NarL/FixJ family response regulator
MTTSVRVVLADDQAMIRSGLHLVLRAEPDITVVAQCADGAEAVAAVHEHHPDVVLMDVRMPRLDGIEATRRLRELGDPVRVLVLTTFDDDDVLWGALDAGADGFVLKDSPAEALAAAIRAVAGGGAWLDPRVTPRVLAAVRTRPSAPQPGRPQPGSPRHGRRQPDTAAAAARLTPRERDVLRLLATGATNQEIADRLRMGERTVKSHVSAVFAKLGARDRVAAVLLAHELGL